MSGTAVVGWPSGSLDASAAGSSQLPPVLSEPPALFPSAELAGDAADGFRRVSPDRSVERGGEAAGARSTMGNRSAASMYSKARRGPAGPRRRDDVTIYDSPPS